MSVEQAVYPLIDTAKEPHTFSYRCRYNRYHHYTARGIDPPTGTENQSTTVEWFNCPFLVKLQSWMLVILERIHQ